MVTFTINIPPMLAYIPYMDPMGLILKHLGTDMIVILSKTAHQQMMLDANTARPSVYELLMMNSHPIHQGALEIVLPTSNNWVCPNEGQEK